MTQAPIRSRIDQTLDVHRECFSKIALDLIFLIDNLADLDDLVLTEIFDPDGAIDPGLVQNVSGGRPADAEYIGQADVRPFFSRQIHSRDTCHIPFPPSLLSLRMASSDSIARVNEGPSQPPILAAPRRISFPWAARCASRSLMRSSSDVPIPAVVCAED